MLMTFIGLAMGPYTMGQLSTAFAMTGMDPANALRTGVFWGYSMLGVAFVLITLACFTIRKDQEKARIVAANTAAA
jgi:hypothetical protein